MIGDMVFAFEMHDPNTETWYRVESRHASTDRTVYRLRLMTFAPYTTVLEADVVRTAADDFYLAHNGKRYPNVTDAGKALLAAYTDTVYAARLTR